MQLSIPSPSLGAQNKTRYSLQTVLRALCVALTMISLITAAKTPVYATQGTWRYCQGNVISNPAAVRWGDGWIDVFSLNQQQQLQQYSAFNGGSRTFTLGPKCISSPTVVQRDKYTLDIYVVGSDLACWHMMYSRNTGFQEIWESLGGRCWDCQNGVFHQYAPAATSNWSLNSGFFWSANGLDVFVIGTDLGLWRKHGVYSSQTATNVSWSNWISCGGTCISSPAAASPTPGVNDVFVLGGDGAIWHWNSWNGGWESLGGYFIGDITVISRGAGRLDLAAVAPSIYGIYLGKVWHRAYYNGAWNNWFGTDVFINSSDYCRPALASWSSNRIDVFGSGSFDFPNWHNTGIDGVGWFRDVIPPAPNGWSYGAPSAVSGFSGVSAFGRLYVISGASLWEQTWTPQTRWKHP